MPTILFINEFRFFFYSNDMNEPPHVYVGKGIAKVWVTPDIRPQYSVNFKVKEEKTY